MIDSARKYCLRLFGNTVDKAGFPYYGHCEFVGETAYRFALEEAGMTINEAELVRIAGYLHDVIEDTDIDRVRLAEDFTAEIAEVVQLLTKEKGRSHEWYLQRLLQNKYATVIKHIDSLHNSMIERFSPEERTPERIKKCEHYAVQSEMLKKKFFEMG